MSEPVIVTPRAARVILRHLVDRRMRVAYRGDPEIYRVLMALEELAVTREGSGDGTRIVIPEAEYNDSCMTVLEAGRKAGVSARAIIKAIDEGRLEANKFGPVWQISEQSLHRWMARRQRQERQAS